MKFVEGGVCAAKGFRAAGLHCGIRKSQTKKDIALVVSDAKASAAAVYTLNLVKSAGITVTKRHLSDGYARAIICNSGIANTCVSDGEANALKMCELTAQAVGIDPADVVCASTGVIGVSLDMNPIAAALPQLADRLSENGHTDAAEAIMTTDTVRKEFAVEFELDGRLCHIGGMAKGSGMIHPNLGTMLVFITSDVAITPRMLENAVRSDVADTFNAVSIDGDTSTNDMVCLLANGIAGNTLIDCENADFDVFRAALRKLTDKLCTEIAKDGEGATKLIVCSVTGAVTKQDAKTIAKSVVCSSLVKTALFGADANWGRVLCAIGYSGASVDVTKVQVEFTSSAGSIKVCENGMGIPFSEDLAKTILTEDEITVRVTLADGDGAAVAKGCDLTYDYVKINGDYRT